MSDNKEKRVPWWMWVLGGLTLLLMLAWGSIRGFLEYQLRQMRRGLTPAQLAQTRQFMDEPVEIPVAWRDVPPWTADFVDASNRWVEENEKFIDAIGPKGLNISISVLLDALEAGALTDADNQNIEKLVAASGPVLAAAEAASRLPSYDLDGVRDRRAGFEVPFHTPTQFIMVRDHAQTLALKADWHHQRGESAEALDAALTILRMARRHPVSALISQMMSGVLQSVALSALQRQIADWTDPALAQRALEELNHLAPELRMEAFARDNLAILDAVAIMRDHKRHGYPVPMEGKRPGVRILWDGVAAMTEYPSWRMAQVPSGSPEWKALQETGPGHGFPVTSSLWTKIVAKLGYRHLVEEMLLSMKALKKVDAGGGEKRVENS
jgi:hypothetical protein